jgi:radical SAM superfamily enzyme YgiQ (UPF0313 family)
MVFVMQYEGLIIRPPSEAASLILQVTVGCSHNLCTFCPAYKSKRYRVKPYDDIIREIDALAAHDATSVRRVFLCDGDPLGMPHAQLSGVCAHLCARFPRLQRIGIYANAQAVLGKSTAEFDELRKNRIAIVYMGLESGDADVLQRIGKGATVADMLAAAERVRAANMKLNVTVLLGIAGAEHSRRHAAETIRVLNGMQPNYVGALTLMLVPGTPLYEAQARGDFELPGKFELVRELRDMLAGSELEQCLFFSNHASNYVPVQARLPRDKTEVVGMLDDVLSAGKESMLRSEKLRGL